MSKLKEAIAIKPKVRDANNRLVMEHRRGEFTDAQYKEYLAIGAIRPVPRGAAVATSEQGPKAKGSARKDRRKAAAENATHTVGDTTISGGGTDGPPEPDNKTIV